MPRYDKLVRDRIPDQLAERGIGHRVRTLVDSEFRTALEAKLREEVAEFEAASDPDARLAELADILEVVHALGRIEGATHEDLEVRRADKARQAGGFEQRLFLIDTE